MMIGPTLKLGSPDNMQLDFFVYYTRQPSSGLFQGEKALSIIDYDNLLCMKRMQE